MAMVVGGNERVRVHKGQKLEDIAKKFGVQPEDVTRADGTQAEGALIPGESLVIHHGAEPNKARAIIALLAETMEAKKAADEAKAAADEARRQSEAFSHAAQDFNGTVKKIRVLLSQGEGSDTKLGDREKGIGLLKELSAAAEKGLDTMDPSSQEPARDVVEGLKTRIAKVEARAQAERAKLTELDKGLDADYKAFTDLANGGKKDRERHLGDTARNLVAKYADPAKLSEGLPPDARKALAEKTANLLKDLNRTIVRFSDESWMDRPDNSYLLGRPGPKMIKNLRKVEDWLGSPAGPIDAKKRTELLDALSSMDEAVRDFDDHVTQNAARAVYDDVFARATARLAGK